MPEKVKRKFKVTAVQEELGGFEGRNGWVNITKFTGVFDGEQSPAAMEVYGDRKATLKEAQTSGSLIEHEVEWNEKYNRWNVYFPKGFGGQGAYRNNNNGGGGPKYRGKACRIDQYLDTQEKVAKAAKKLVDALAGSATDENKLKAVVDLTQTYWVSVRENVTFPEGCEPAAKPAEGAAAPPAENKPTGGGGQQSIPGAGPGEGQSTFDVLKGSIEKARPGDLPGIEARINSGDGLDDSQAYDLGVLLISRKRALGIGQSGGEEL